MAKVTVHMLNKHGRDAENKEDPFRDGVIQNHQNEFFCLLIFEHFCLMCSIPKPQTITIFKI